MKTFTADRWANILLIGALGLLLVSLVVPEPARAWLLAAAEGALVGAIADLFAVKALFHKIPIPGISRHTNIIIRNKIKLGNALAAFVGDEFLGREHLRANAQRFISAERIGNWLIHPRNRKNLVRIGVGYLSASAKFLRSEAVSERVGRGLDDLTARLNATHIVKIAVNNLTRSQVDTVLGVLLLQTADQIEENNDHIAKELLKGRLATIGKLIGARRWVSKRIDKITDDLANPASELRAEISDKVWTWVLGVRDGSVTMEYVEHAVSTASKNPEVRSLSKEAWKVALNELQRDAADADSVAARHLDEGLRQFGEALLEDKEFSARMDDFLAQIADVVSQQSVPVVSDLIKTKFAEWQPDQLISRLESQIGQELQFIRINGTALGALLGLGLHAIVLGLDRLLG